MDYVATSLKHGLRSFCYPLWALTPWISGYAAIFTLQALIFNIFPQGANLSKCPLRFAYTTHSDLHAITTVVFEKKPKKIKKRIKKMKTRHLIALICSYQSCYSTHAWGANEHSHSKLNNRLCERWPSWMWSACHCFTHSPHPSFW